MRKILTVIIVILLSTRLFAANEIQVAYESGSNLYAQFIDVANDKIWDSNTTAWVTYSAGDWADYNTPLTDCDYDIYKADFPGTISAGYYLVSAYRRAGAMPATNDNCLGTGEITWNGSAEEKVIDTSGQVDVGQIEGSDATDQINTEADTALSDYDPPTKAELDTGLAGLNDPTAAAIADAVWDELSAGHTGAGKAGDQLWDKMDAVLFDTGTTLDNKIDAIDASAIADAVWDEQSAGHTAAGMAGQQLWTDIDDILIDTGATLDNKLNTIDNFLDTEIAAILADTAAMDTSSELRTLLTGSDTPVSTLTYGAFNDPMAAAIADAVWNETSAGHTDAGKAGAQVWTDIDAILADTGATLDGKLTTIETKIDTVDDYVDTEIAAILADTSAMDTSSELRTLLTGSDTAVSTLTYGAFNDPTSAAVANAIWDELIADHTGAGSFGAKNQKLVPSETINDYKADVSAVALEANVEGHVTTVLGTYDPPTKAELDSGLAGLNDPTAAAVADAVWDEQSAGHTDVGKAGAQIWTKIDLILVDTGTTLNNMLEAIDNFLDTEIAAILADTSAMDTSTELRTLLTGSDTAVSTLTYGAFNDPTAAAIVAALMADTGITAGGTYTFEDYCKAMGAYTMGTWQDKGGDSAVQELLDWEDDATVVLELTGSVTSPYKNTTKK